MSQHLKSIVKRGLKGYIGRFVSPSEISASHRRGVCYFEPIECYNAFWGAMNSVKDGRRYKKHIIVRRCPRHAVLQLYTYHFPKAWSAACVANRELIKEAQRRAHALERDHSLAAIEWHIRFLKHYFRVCRGGEKPEPGMKPYSRFYQYTYVAIYRELKAAQQVAKETAELTDTPLPPTADEVTFDPIEYRPLRARRTYPLQYVVTPNSYITECSQAPPWQNFYCQNGRAPARGTLFDRVKM